MAHAGNYAAQCCRHPPIEQASIEQVSMEQASVCPSRLPRARLPLLVSSKLTTCTLTRERADFETFVPCKLPVLLRSSARRSGMMLPAWENGVVKRDGTRLAKCWAGGSEAHMLGGAAKEQQGVVACGGPRSLHLEEAPSSEPYSSCSIRTLTDSGPFLAAFAHELIACVPVSQCCGGYCPPIQLCSQPDVSILCL